MKSINAPSGEQMMEPIIRDPSASVVSMLIPSVDFIDEMIIIKKKKSTRLSHVYLGRQPASQAFFFQPLSFAGFKTFRGMRPPRPQ
jgi:hypothetical protein